MYADFHPEVNEWGRRSEIRCSVTLDFNKMGSKLTQAELGNDETLTIWYGSQKVLMQMENQEPRKRGR